MTLEDKRTHYAAMQSEIQHLREENRRLIALISRPYIGQWADEVIVEAAHQRERWGDSHDSQKEPADWFWLLGFLAGKALRAHVAGDLDKARHHTVSSGAALVHWAAAIAGDETVFRPGLGAAGLIPTGVGMDASDAEAQDSTL